MAHITWLSLARLEEEWAADFGPQRLFFAPLVSLRIASAELKPDHGAGPVDLGGRELGGAERVGPGGL